MNINIVTYDIHSSCMHDNI